MLNCRMALLMDYVHQSIGRLWASRQHWSKGRIECPLKMSERCQVPSPWLRGSCLLLCTHHFCRIERVTFRRRSKGPKFWSQRRFGGACPLLAFCQHLQWRFRTVASKICLLRCSVFSHSECARRLQQSPIPHASLRPLGAIVVNTALCYEYLARPRP